MADESTQLNREALTTMSAEQIVEAKNDGRLDLLLGIRQPEDFTQQEATDGNR